MTDYNTLFLLSQKLQEAHSISVSFTDYQTLTDLLQSSIDDVNKMIAELES